MDVARGHMYHPPPPRKETADTYILTPITCCLFWYWNSYFAKTSSLKKIKSQTVARLTDHDDVITPLLRGVPRLGLALSPAPARAGLKMNSLTMNKLFEMSAAKFMHSYVNNLLRSHFHPPMSYPRLSRTFCAVHVRFSL